MITFEDFKKMDLKVGLIKEVSDHPDADRLYVIKVDLGDGTEKQLVAGIKKHYQKEELTGRKVAIVSNMEPAVIRGVESQGMLLAAQNKEDIVILTLDRDILQGSIIK